MRNFWIISLSAMLLASCASPVVTSQPTATPVPSTATPVPTETITPTPLPPEIMELLQNGGRFDPAQNGYVDKEGKLQFVFEDGKLDESAPAAETKDLTEYFGTLNPTLEVEGVTSSGMQVKGDFGSEQTTLGLSRLPKIMSCRVMEKPRKILENKLIRTIEI